MNWVTIISWAVLIAACLVAPLVAAGFALCYWAMGGFKRTLPRQ